MMSCGKIISLVLATALFLTAASGCEESSVPINMSMNVENIMQDEAVVGYRLVSMSEPVSDFIIPTQITVIGEECFKDDRTIASVAVDGEAEYNLQTIEASAFEGCKRLTAVTLPHGMKEIGSRAFFGCSNIEKIEIPEGVETIEKQAFAYCMKLSEVKLSESVKEIGNSAFKGCTMLGSINIPASVTCISEEAFEDCYALASVTLSESVKSVERWAFADCNSLTQIYIPAGIEKIDDSAFASCDALTNVTYGGTIKEWLDITNDNIGLEVGCSVNCSDGSYVVQKYDDCISSVDEMKAGVPYIQKDYPMLLLKSPKSIEYQRFVSTSFFDDVPTIAKNEKLIIKLSKTERYINVEPIFCDRSKYYSDKYIWCRDGDWRFGWEYVDNIDGSKDFSTAMLEKIWIYYHFYSNGETTSHTVGYFEGTEYCEEVISVNKYYIDYNGSWISCPFINKDARAGYFEIDISGLQPGYYCINRHFEKKLNNKDENLYYFFEVI